MHARNPHSPFQRQHMMDCDLPAQQDTGTMQAVIGQDPMIAGQVSKPLLSVRSEMNAELRGEDKAATSDSELNEPLLAPVESNDSEDTPSKLFGARGNTILSDPGTPEQHQASQTHPPFPVGPQPLLTAQQLASAVAGVMPGGPPALNQPILIPFNMAGQLGGQQGLVLTLPTANLTNIQGLVAAAAAGGIMTLPLQNLQATSSLNSQLQQLQQLQLQQQQQQQQQQQLPPPPTSQHPQPASQAPSQSQQQQSQPTPPHQPPPASQQPPAPPAQLQQATQSQQHQPHSHPQSQNQSSPSQQSSSPPQKPSPSPGHSLPSPLTPPNPLQLVNNPLASQAAAAAAAMGSIASSQAFGNALSSLQGVTGQLVTNAQGQIIGTIPLMPNPGPTSQAASGTQGLQVQPITPQLLTNAQGQIIATVIGNQILPVINTQGITLSPIKPGQQLHQSSQTSVGQAGTQGNLLHLAHGQASTSQSPVRQASSSSSSSSSSSALSVGQLVSNPQTASGEVDGVNLEEIREFAKAFKIRRLSLGLTQTQVGQALSATEGPAYSQSAICRHTILRSHFFLPQEAQENTIASSLTAKLNPGLLYPARFEKLDITPKSAQKIKPVLERWMAEAEARHRAGMQNLTEFIGSEPSKKRKRRTSFTPQALEILNAHFEKNTHPSGQEMTEIAEKLNYDREVVRVWFCNKRQALKNTIKRLKQHEPTSAVPLEPLADSPEENC
ncbi:POU domain, class 6, transcription factor 2 [Cricetulus griseus]|uniref:POU domain protein n=1 Tax=Cricetulus griseus TaxID=10029 RepID=A0A9J7JKM1_CRIGR|nr:POU domain, class 6, transcription factor 2 [Cricetulus griseus]XP_027265184.2 POU domain, class 6, transcription factor 2 [Cricetulus griseus]